jgi:hypothetical protein
MSKKIQKEERYLLVPTDMIVSEGGVSIYSLLREGDFSRDLTQKYHNDVNDAINMRLNKLVSENKATEKEIKRIKDLIGELVHTNEILVTYDLENPQMQKILEK